MERSEFIIASIKKFIEEGKIDNALELLVENIKSIEAAFTVEAIMLSGQFNRAKNEYYVKNILSRSEFDKVSSRIAFAILEVIKRIEKKATNPVKRKNGKLLHKIPPKMSLDTESKCIIRIAYDEDILIKDILVDENTKIENVQVAEVMSVELLDTNESPAFQIRTYTDEEQYIISEDYTQWIFLVKPLRLGKFVLTLKVRVIEIINDKERKRNIVVDKEIWIESEIDEVDDSKYSVTGITINVDATSFKGFGGFLAYHEDYYRSTDWVDRKIEIADYLTDWEKLKSELEQVHPNFITELKKQFPDISNNAVRFCAYVKMGLSIDEIAILFNTSTKRIGISSQKLKQTMNIDQSVSLTDFIKSI